VKGGGRSRPRSRRTFPRRSLHRPSSPGLPRGRRSPTRPRSSPRFVTSSAGTPSRPKRRRRPDLEGSSDVAGLKPPEPQAVVIFGASGDLTRRKLLPAFWHLFVEGLLPDGFAIVGYARTEMTDEQFREAAHAAIGEFGRADPTGERWNEFASRLSYLTGEFESENAMEHLRERL